MTDITSVLPGFATTLFAHLLPSLDKNCITTADLLTLEVAEIAKRAQIPAVEAAKLIDAVLEALHSENDKTTSFADEGAITQGQLGEDEPRDTATDPPISMISTLDDDIDQFLGGGLAPGYLSEITGESGVGKTQLLLTLLLSVQRSSSSRTNKSAIYISTEAALATSRLYQLLHHHPRLCNLPKDAKPSLDRILSMQVSDLESQDHILRYQLPVAIKTRNIGLVVIDSIAANFRAEFEKPVAALERTPIKDREERKVAKAMAERRSQLILLGSFLRDLARKENIAIVVANQVADRFSPTYSSQPTSSLGTAITPDPLALDHQQRWFTGWGDSLEWSFATNLKTPSLGLIWTNQLAARIALTRQTWTGGELKQRRWLRVVFAPWCSSSAARGVEYDISAQGVRALRRTKEQIPES